VSPGTDIDRLEKRLLHGLGFRLDRLARLLERAQVAEYVQMLQRPRRIIFISFISGLFRGLGFAVGFTLLGALVIYLLQIVVRLNLPVIGRFIADLVRIVQVQLQAF